MPVSQRIINESIAEAQVIFQWVAERERNREKPITVLVGGWAIYTYNRYYGSIDIDLVTNSSTKGSLETFLIDTRGYQRRHDPESQVPYVCKDFGQIGIVEIDFATRNSLNRFENRIEELPFSMLDDNTVLRSLNDTMVPVPTRSMLLLMKMKAAWDRQWRLDHGRSRDAFREQGKLEKDRSDILALIDPEKGGSELSIGFLGSQLQRLPFLDVVIELVSSSADAAEKYGITHVGARDMIDRFRDLVT